MALMRSREMSTSVRNLYGHAVLLGFKPRT